jgi:hypothetical protein
VDAKPSAAEESSIGLCTSLSADEAGAELCRARYIAKQVAGHVVLFALGVHQTSGRVVFFRRDPASDFPPHFSLWHVRGGASPVHAVTPFATSVSFQTIKHVAEVLVTDSAGGHLVAVEEA